MPDQNLPAIERRMESLLRNVAEEIRPCKACGAELAMVRHRNGKLAPCTMAGLNHFIDCAKAGQFRRRTGGAA